MRSFACASGLYYKGRTSEFLALWLRKHAAEFADALFVDTFRPVLQNPIHILQGPFAVAVLIAGGGS